jgi:predicted nucleic acid-binding protein
VLRIDDPGSGQVRQDRISVVRCLIPPLRDRGRLERQRNELAEHLSTLRTAPLTNTVIRAAEHAMRTLAHRGPGAHRIPIVDYLLGAAAQNTASAVLHYDHDFDTLAEIMSFESIWLAPAASIP